MRITLNLATRPFADLGPAIKRLRIGMAVLAVLAIVLGLGLHFFAPARPKQPAPATTRSTARSPASPRNGRATRT